MENIMPVSDVGQGGVIMSDPKDQTGMMQGCISGGMEAAFNTSAGLLEPSVTSSKLMWGAMKSEPESDSQGSKTRWKPNSQQLCLLEQHFKSGKCRSTWQR